MQPSILSAKMGARFSVTHLDPAGVVITPKVTGDNLILNIAKNYIQNGFNDLPTPVLGGSVLPVTADQTGPLNPLPGMVAEAPRPAAGSEFTRVSDKSARNSWVVRYIYLNSTNAPLTVAEIGIPNFNRALFLDSNNEVRAWTVSPGEKLVVDMQFAIAFTAPSVDTEVNARDLDNQIVDTYSVAMNVTNSTLPGEDPQWWKLLSKPADEVVLITDPNFDGLTLPTNPGFVLPVNMSSPYLYNDSRQITINIQHQAAAGGITVYGIMCRFGCLTPGIAAKFSKGVVSGGGYTFRSQITVNW